MVASAERRLFILPATILILVLSIFPLLFSLGLTLTNVRLLGQNNHFTGWANWAQLVQDRNFRQILTNTITFVMGGATLQYIFGLGLALVLNEDLKFRRFWRVSFILPMMISPVAISYIIGKMVLDETYGPIYDLAHRLHLSLPNWTTSAPLSMLVLILVDTWQWTPFFVLVLLAGLQAIQPELYEAARIDGASSGRLFRHITFPLLMPLSVTAFLIRSLEMFKVIDIVRVVTGGGPGQATEPVTLFAYDLGIKGGDISYASTLAYALLIVVILYANGFLAVAKRVTPDQG